MNDLLILTLLNVPQISRKIIFKLIMNNNREYIVFENIVSLIQQSKFFNNRIKTPTDIELEAYKKSAKSLISDSLKNEIYSITILDEDFPEKLKAIEDPPVILFYKGNKKCIYDKKSIAIIGTRTPTKFGEEISEKLGSIFGSENFVVVSGLAKGCDEFAHKGCVTKLGRSIAVLPGGLDKVYPASNKTLANLILQKNGCLVSEYPIATKPFKSSFIERDRIQSALSQAVIVVETDISGGTMHTVDFTLKQNKILACYKHSNEYLDLIQTKGNQQLLKEKKAISIYSKNDIENLKTMIEYKIKNDSKTESPVIVVQQKLF